jgi:hypothetical protein
MAVEEIHDVVVIVLPFLPMYLPEKAATVRGSRGRSRINKYIVVSLMKASMLEHQHLPIWGRHGVATFFSLGGAWCMPPRGSSRGRLA